MTSYLVYCIIGRVCIFLLQKFPFHKLFLVGKLFIDGGFLHELFSCDLCLGVWVYWTLAFLFGINIIQDYTTLPVISELITGGITSLLVHLVRLGWETKFSVIEVK